MKKSDLINIIREELQNVLTEIYNSSNENKAWEATETCEGDGCLDEKTIARHEPPRKMSKSQIKDREKIGISMKKRPGVEAHYKHKHGQDWESYLWAAATNKALAGKKKKAKKRKKS